MVLHPFPPLVVEGRVPGEDSAGQYPRECVPPADERSVRAQSQNQGFCDLGPWRGMRPLGEVRRAEKNKLAEESWLAQKSSISKTKSASEMNFGAKIVERAAAGPGVRGLLSKWRPVCRGPRQTPNRGSVLWTTGTERTISRRRHGLGTKRLSTGRDSNQDAGPGRSGPCSWLPCPARRAGPSLADRPVSDLPSAHGAARHFFAHECAKIHLRAGGVRSCEIGAVLRRACAFSSPRRSPKARCILHAKRRPDLRNLGHKTPISSLVTMSLDY